MSRRGLMQTLMIMTGACLLILRFAYPSWSEDLDEATNPAIRENLLPAQKGDPQAQVFVGYLYETGQGVQQNHSRAAQWYWKAAEQGNSTAQYQLGNMYHQGKGIAQNYIMAYMWLDLAASAGNLGAKDVRRIVASKMSPTEIADAKRMAEDWRNRKH